MTKHTFSLTDGTNTCIDDLSEILLINKSQVVSLCVNLVWNSFHQADLAKCSKFNKLTDFDEFIIDSMINMSNI